MIEIVDVVKAINMRLKQAYPSITIQSSDVKEGYSRPCFYTEVTDLNTEMLMTSYDRKIAVISILYFPSDPHNYQLEILQVRERLQGVFISTLSVNDDFSVHIFEVEDTVSDGVLTLDMELEYYVRRQEKEFPIMEHIEINKL